MSRHRSMGGLYFSGIYRWSKSCSVSFFFIFLVLVSPLVRLSLGLFTYLVLFSVLGLVAAVFLVQNRLVGYRMLVPFLLLSFLMMYGLLLSLGDKEPFFFSLVSLVYFIIACWAAFKNDVARAARAALILFYAYFVASMLIHGYTPADINNFYDEGSRNVVSATALFLQIMYTAAHFRERGELPKITPILTFLVALISYGRSGVALSAFLMFFTFFYLVVKGGVRPAFLVSASLLVLILVLFFGAEWLELAQKWVYENTKFSSGFDTPRSLMNSQYIEGLSGHEFLFGRDLSAVPEIYYHLNNPHNSFVYGHSKYGVFYLLLVLWFFLALVFFGFQNKGRLVYSVLLFVFLVRIYIDKLTFPGIFDFILYYLYFVAVYRDAEEGIGKGRGNSALIKGTRLDDEY